MSDFEETLNKLMSSPEDMAKIAGLASQFIGSREAASEAAASTGENPLASLDPKLIGTLSKLLGEYNGASDKAALIAALEPFIGGEQRGKLAKAAQMARIARVAKAAFNEMGNGGIFGV